MRTSFSIDLGFNYKHFLHTHSHIALLGWLYNLSLIFIGYYFFKENLKKFNRIFWISQITFLGMLLSFPFQGYSFWSITFSTLYLIASYWLIIEIFRCSKNLRNQFEYKLLRAGGQFLFLSSIGPLALGAIMANGLQTSIWYSLSIYWFLHFLFNGFFYTVFLALLISQLNKLIGISDGKVKWVYYLTVFSIIPLYAGFAIESIPSNWVVSLAILSSIAQLITVLIIFNELKLLVIQVSGPISKTLVGLALVALVLKMIFQLFASFPFLEEMVFNSKSTLIIGYLHMVMLGMFSLFFIWLLVAQQIIATNKLFNVALWIFIIGVIGSEALLFAQGLVNYFWQTSLPNYYLLLYTISGLMPVGILGMLVAQSTSSLSSSSG
jgi:hypothetical protein